MNAVHQKIHDYVASLGRLSEEELMDFSKLLKEADKALLIAEFKLDRTEKVKRTTAILLEETIEELEQKRIAVEEANAALKKSLEELKAAQALLIQAEKMASLGELTAGIAHEIQNPLNFVNNFSELSKELLEELQEEIQSGDLEEVQEIANSVISNLEKITHHGKRADSIVKGMLLHSRKSEGEKIETDIHQLIDEYLRLAYHGFRAKHKSFQAEIKKELDPAINKIFIIPQDVGRVILNILNNSFQVINDPTVINRADRNVSPSESYEGIVEIKTKNLEDKIEITISDNGPGIPDNIKDKIFQPFFTTKPTGQGTGLGLSLSYDIIKAHGGELKLITGKEKMTSFKIILPY